MADATEPKKETVRNGLPTEPVATPARANAKSRETVRIQLPIRPPSTNVPVRSPVEQYSPPKPPANDPIAPLVVPHPPPTPSSRSAAGAPPSTCRVRPCTESASFWTKERDSAPSARARAALQAASEGRDEKDSTACCHAANCSPERVNRSGTS